MDGRRQEGKAPSRMPYLTRLGVAFQNQNSRKNVGCLLSCRFPAIIESSIHCETNKVQKIFGRVHTVYMKSSGLSFHEVLLRGRVAEA